MQLKRGGTTNLHKFLAAESLKVNRLTLGYTSNLHQEITTEVAVPIDYIRNTNSFASEFKGVIKHSKVTAEPRSFDTARRSFMSHLLPRTIFSTSDVACYN